MGAICPRGDWIDLRVRILRWRRVYPRFSGRSASEGYLTAYADSGLVSRIQPFPGKAFYRIRENP